MIENDSGGISRMSLFTEAAVVAVLATISFIVWLVRLEGKVKFAQTSADEANQNVKDLRTRVQLIDSELVEKISEIEKSLARIEGYMQAKSEQT
jgi:hypothetical protein